LRRVPVDGVKIDRSFVADVLRDPDDLALTTAIIAMAHSLGITVVAEGVEKEGQYDVLRERGCDLAQGYWLGYPMNVHDFRGLLGWPTPALPRVRGAALAKRPGKAGVGVVEGTCQRGIGLVFG